MGPARQSKWRPAITFSSSGPSTTMWPTLRQRRPTRCAPTASKTSPGPSRGRAAATCCACRRTPRPRNNVVCSVPGHCGTGQKLVIDVSPVYACNSGDDGQDEAEDDTDTEAEDDTGTEDEGDTDTEDEGGTDTEDEGDTDAEGENEDMESGVVIDAEISGNATLTSATSVPEREPQPRPRPLSVKLKQNVTVFLA